MQKTLVTGNLGYIGQVLVSYLKKFGYEIRALDYGYYNDCDLFYNMGGAPHEQLMKDIRDIVKEDLEGIESIIHLAALSNDPLGELDGEVTEDINYKATVRLAEIAKEVGVRRFIFSSSCSVYGKKGKEVLTEKDEVLPLTNYAKSKVMAEEGILSLADENFCPTVMRNATVYGLSPSMRLDLVVNNLAALGWTMGKILIMSDGEPWRPLIHVEDLCQAFQVILNAPEEKLKIVGEKKIKGQIFNVGFNDGNWRIREIGEQVSQELMNCKMEILNATEGDDRSYRVSFYKFYNTFSEFKPKWTLRLGIKDLIAGYVRYGLVKGDLDNPKFFRLKQIKKLQEAGKLDKEFRWTQVKNLF